MYTIQIAIHVPGENNTTVVCGGTYNQMTLCHICSWGVGRGVSLEGFLLMRYMYAWGAYIREVYF